MQTRFGSNAALVALVAAAALSWTGQWTGWFSPEDPARYLWIFGGLVVALGQIRLIDRRIWTIRARRARLARRKAAQEAAEAERAAYEKWRQDFLQVLSEPVGDEPVADSEPRPTAQ